MEWDELENALAWFKSAPAEWIDSAGESLAAAAEWIWESQPTSASASTSGRRRSLGIDELLEMSDGMNK